jgi:hypothetical protein
MSAFAKQQTRRATPEVRKRRPASFPVDAPHIVDDHCPDILHHFKLHAKRIRKADPYSVVAGLANVVGVATKYRSISLAAAARVLGSGAA